MKRLGRTFVRLNTDTCVRIDRMRRHASLSRDRLVNWIIRDYLEIRSAAAEPRLPRRRTA
jgi:hypothetical protein